MHQKQNKFAALRRFVQKHRQFLITILKPEPLITSLNAITVIQIAPVSGNLPIIMSLMEQMMALTGRALLLTTFQVPLLAHLLKLRKITRQMMIRQVSLLQLNLQNENFNILKNTLNAKFCLTIDLLHFLRH